MKRANQIMLTVIAMVVIMIAAVGIDKGISRYEEERKKEERMEQYRQAYAQASQLQMEISQLARDQAAIEAFIEENRAYFETEVWEDEASGNAVSENEVSDNAISGNTVSKNGVSGNAISGNTVSENRVSGNTVSGNTVSGNTVSGNAVSENNIAGTDISENSISENSISGNSTSGNSISEDSAEERNVSDNDLAGSLWRKTSADYGQMETGAAPGAYMKTLYASEWDRNVIENSQIDFSQMTIACLGDSITEASNLDGMENFQQYSYPEQLREILGAKSVVNLGIGGSSIGRYWDQPFVERYKEIPREADIIIVMGGTNDGFCLDREDLGSLEERQPGTFIGDLDELMRGLKENYPDAFILFATPPANVLHDMLRKEREYLLPQREIAAIIRQLAQEHHIPVADLYGSGMLDTHDAAVIYNYMPDGVHGNPAGYRILAQHIAAEIIQKYDRQ